VEFASEKLSKPFQIHLESLSLTQVPRRTHGKDTQAVNSNKRAAQSKVVRMMVSDVGQKREEKYPQTVQ